MDNRKIAVYAGSFDPFTNGHLDIVRRASELFDNVVIYVADNASKHKFYNPFEMAQGIIRVLGNEKIHNCCVEFPGTPRLVVDVCREYHSNYIVRGLRNTTDFMYEEDIAKINQKLAPEIKTVYLRAEDDAISSSMVRELLKYNKDVSTYVPKEIHKILMEYHRDYFKGDGF